MKVEAARRGQRLKDLVTLALRQWLESQEDAELLPAIEKARAEWKQEGGVEAGEFFRRIEEKGDADALQG